MKSSLQWGGRFRAPPDPALIAFGSSLEEDLVLAPFDLQCSRAHLAALSGGKIVDRSQTAALSEALDAVDREIQTGALASFARASGAEDVHGVIDARVRELAPRAGAALHSGRSRNDQVATTLLLYAADRAAQGQAAAARIARWFLDRAEDEIEARTCLAAATHWQPAQPVLLAFWLCAAAEPFVRDAKRCAAARTAALRFCPLGSGALAGSSLALDRSAASEMLGFQEPSRNALDAVGNRDAALDIAHAFVRTAIDAARICNELVIWCTPQFGYARLGDAAATGSSLMPQKRNPDPFELVRATAATLNGTYAGAVAALGGIPLSYHRDLQVVKASVIEILERGLAALCAFERALLYVHFDRARMNENAERFFIVATDIADALIGQGVAARDAHAAVGDAVAAAEEEGRELEDADLQRIAQACGLTSLAAPLDAQSSIAAKATAGSTSMHEVRRTMASLREELAAS